MDSSLTDTSQRLRQHGQKKLRGQINLAAPDRTTPRGGAPQGTAVCLTLRKTLPISPMMNT